MTWHAATFLLWQLLLLVVAAAAFFVFWMMPHRGHHWMRAAGVREDLRLAVGATVVIIAGFLFIHILRGVMHDATLAEADLRLHNTVRLFRSETLHKRYSGVSRAASTLFVLPMVIALAAISWAAGRHREAVAVLAALLLESILSIALKYIVHRPRPPDAIPLHLGPSFPSGHTLAAAVVYGFIAYLLLRDEKRRKWLIPAAALIVFIAFVPLSRVYLGVHWPYDTIASLTLGVALLAILVTLYKYPLVDHWIFEKTRGEPWFMNAVIACTFTAIAAAFVFGYLRELPEARPVPPPVRGSVSVAALQSFPSQLKKTSEDLIGGPMEPVSFLLVGSPDQMLRAFSRAGWQLADTPSATGLARELLAVIEDAPDPHGPATPAYFEAQPQDFTFERAGTADGSIRHRHHTRIWRAPLLIDSNREPLWVATCSYDMGVEFVPKPYLITHRIDPNVDRERELIAAQLRAAGARDIAFVPVTGPQRGRNAGGDDFYTDGRAHVLLLP